jgi:E1A/CREB-binding protein
MKLEKKEKEINSLNAQFESQAQTLNMKLDYLNQMLKNSSTKVDILFQEKRNLQKKLCRLKINLNKTKETVSASSIENLTFLQSEVKELGAKVESLNKENIDLNGLLKLLEDEEIVTFERGRYSNDIREVIMELLSLNVSMNKVNDVIKIVLKKLAKKRISKLPSVGTRSRFMSEALIIAQIQVSAEMLDSVEKDTGNCLHGDGTTKYHRHFQNFQLTSKSGRMLSFGLSELASGDAASTLSSLTETLDDICDILDTKDREKDFAKLICSFKTTMSDLGSVNPLFNNKFKEMRELLLPKVIEHWDSLAIEQKNEFKDMSNFFCKLHLLTNFATETDKVLNSFEKLALSDNHEDVFAFKTSESGAARLIRTACKAFHKRGSDEAGVAGYFNSFLIGKGEDKCMFAPFIGNRFNILFYNGAALYYHSESIKEFISQWPNPNNLLKAVYEDISNLLFLAESRALGIFDKLITGPLWRLIEENKNILSMNKFLFRLKMKLSDLCKDASSMLNQTPVFDPRDVKIHKDKLYEKLFEETGNIEFDVLVQQSLEIISHAFLIILERQAIDQLPGGKYWNSDDRIQKAAENVPTTNKASESDFAILDLLIRTKPNAKVQTIQAYTMWYRNKTLDWLDAKSEKERYFLIEKASHSVEKMKVKYKERQVELISKKSSMLIEKQQLKADTEKKASLKKANIVNELIQLKSQVWLTAEEAKDKSSKIDNDSLRKQVVRVQLDFYRYVMGAKCLLALFYKTKVSENKRIDLSSDELMENLVTVISTCNFPPPEKISNTLKEKNQRNDLIKKQKEELFTKLKDSRMSHLAKQKRIQFLPALLNDPVNLVGRVILHKIKEADEEEYFWCKADVVKIGNIGKKVKKTLYDVIYESEPGSIYSFPLLSDFDKGDMILL